MGLVGYKYTIVTKIRDRQMDSCAARVFSKLVLTDSELGYEIKMKIVGIVFIFPMVLVSLNSDKWLRSYRKTNDAI